jgi:hypothetical protein
VLKKFGFDSPSAYLNAIPPTLTSQRMPPLEPPPGAKVPPEDAAEEVYCISSRREELLESVEDERVPEPAVVDLRDQPRLAMQCRQWASAEQQRAIDALCQHGSPEAAAQALGVTAAQLNNQLSEVARRAARAGWSPPHDYIHAVPDGFHVKGVSTYYGEDGTRRGQWVKTQIDREHRVQLLLRALQNIAEPFKGKAEPCPAPAYADEDLLAVYPMGDPHIGMFSWPKETGEAFDVQIAETNLVNAVDQLSQLAPPAKHALIVNLGDFYHSDNFEARTARNDNALDVDNRWSKVLAVGLRTMRRCIDRAAAKHEKVSVICEIGNHDDHSAIMLAQALSMYYERDDRIRIDVSPAPFHWYRHGLVLLGVTHGDNVKPAELPGIMATDRARDWGETRYRHWYTGHVHHKSGHEYPGVTIESLRSLAAKDAWHFRNGYRSDRDMRVDVWHASRGLVLQHTVGIEQLAAFKP